MMRLPAKALLAVALGASDTVGVGATRPAREGWAPLVHAGLPEGARFVNLGVSGATLRDVLAQQAPVAVDAAPRWVTIWPGVNDLRAGVDLAQFTAHLDTLLGDLTRAGGGGGPPRIVVLNLPDLRAVPALATGDGAALDRRVREWNAAIAGVAGRYAPTVVLVDLYAQYAELGTHPEYVSADGFHPSSAGYRRIADLALAGLRGAEGAAR
jgi:lysophospholipase L1-like esterase